MTKIGETRLMESMPCTNCGIVFGLPEGFISNRRGDKRQFWCPNGHIMSWAENEADRLRRERDRLQQQMARVEQEKAEAWATANAEADRRRAAERLAEGRLKRLRSVGERVHRGVCPHCNRSFVQLARHMATKHPGGPKMLCEVAS